LLTLRGKLALILVSVVFIFATGDLKAASTKTSQLPEIYKHWLNEEVNYLITDAERDAFLQLETNQDRDTFIENFWKVRNPDLTAPSNEAKDEHYRRLAYANEQFGFRGADNGWRTDRGMVYITLGAPKQTARYLNTKYLHQMEIWFYQSPGPALPVYFSVIFFKPSPSEDFRLYSPYSDRPEKLITSNTPVNDEPRAVRMIQQDTNDEVAHLSLSLLPDEPVDLHEAYPSLQSDVLLSNISNYRNLDENRRLLEQRKSLLEGVTHRILLGEQFNAMDVLATRDGDSKASIHYLFRFLHPQDFALAQQADGRFYYSLNAQRARE
jgi:GWxTD domain-containing protein